MFYTDDPVRDFENYDREMARRIARLPVCAECREHIQSEDLYDINGELYCEECMHNHKRSAIDYILE
jgi:formylmethanofuran dehydrogenase subunit E